jgi:hypothetical protein
VGARPSAILFQFLIEATMLCLMGGLGRAAGRAGIDDRDGEHPAGEADKAYIPGWAIALSFGFSPAWA